MSEYDNEKRGVLFKNDDKRPDKKDPDYKGHCEIEGVQYWLSAWIGKSKAGVPYMSLRMNPKDDAKKREVIEKMPAATETPAFNDEIPF